MSRTIRKGATHDRGFHADDVVFAIMARLLWGDFPIIRTRDPARWSECDLVWDVGGVDDPALGRYDHHQRGGAGRRPSDDDTGVAYASAGLFSKTHGVDFATKFASPYDLDPARLADLFDQRFIQGIDADDLGKVDSTVLYKGTPRPLTIVSFPDLIRGLNPVAMVDPQTDAAFDEAFFRAIDLGTPLVIGELNRLLGELAAERYVLTQGGTQPMLLLDEECEWEATVGALLPDVRIVVFKSGDGYKVQAAPSRWPNPSFETRLKLPAAWGGKNGTALAEITGVPDVVFCHPGLWLAKASSREGAVKLAALALRADAA